MREIYTITGLERIPAAMRWRNFVEPLARKLAESGLGEIVGFSELQPNSDSEELDTEEVAIRLNNYDYGKELLDQHLRSTGVFPDPTNLPTRWRDYPCDEYYKSDYSSSGYWDEP